MKCLAIEKNQETADYYHYMEKDPYKGILLSEQQNHASFPRVCVGRKERRFLMARNCLASLLNNRPADGTWIAEVGVLMQVMVS